MIFADRCDLGHHLTPQPLSLLERGNQNQSYALSFWFHSPEGSGVGGRGHFALPVWVG